MLISAPDTISAGGGEPVEVSTGNMVTCISNDRAKTFLCSLAKLLIEVRDNKLLDMHKNKTVKIALENEDIQSNSLIIQYPAVKELLNLLIAERLKAGKV